MQPFQGETDDNELEYLGKFLENFATIQDVRPVMQHFLDYQKSNKDGSETIRTNPLGQKEMGAVLRQIYFSTDFEEIDEGIVDTDWLKLSKINTQTMSALKQSNWTSLTQGPELSKALKEINDMMKGGPKTSSSLDVEENADGDETADMLPIMQLKSQLTVFKSKSTLL